MPGDDDCSALPPDDIGAAAAGRSDGASPADSRLIEGLLRGDESSVRALVDRYDRLVRFTIFKTSRRECARDPNWLDARANEAWTGIVSALRRRGRGAIPPNVPAYFARIARNKSLDAIEREGRQAAIPFDQAGAEPDMTEPEADPHNLLESVEEVTALRDCIARLNEDEQVICAEIGLILERRWREAAEELEMPESTLRSRWGNILDKLRACLEKKNQKKFRA
ncbi:MAG TPA: RNA polymerase sigma factor [Phycisphaerae bacterium]|nr:RNA polymerase sigma factor [Phycisphaerae bacterium]